MNLRKTSILVLCGLMSYDSLAALPSGRISTIRIGTTSTDNRSTTASSTNRAATVSNYSKAATNQARASTTKALDGITSNADSIAELKTAMQEMQAQMNDALEQMNETLAEKDEVIEALSKEVTDYKSKYEEIKSAVEAMDDMMDDVAKADDLKAITTDLKAVHATAEENKNNFKNYATLKDLNNLELGTDESTVNKIIDSKLADFAPMEALESVLATLKANDQLSERYKEQIAELEAKMEDIRVRADSHDSYQDLIADLKMRLDDIRAQLVAFVTREELAIYAKLDDLKTVKVGADEDQVTKIIDSKLVGFATADDLKLYAKAEDLQKMSAGADEATVEKMIEDQSAALANDLKDLEKKMEAVAVALDTIAGVSINLKNGNMIMGGYDFRSLKALTDELGMVSQAEEWGDRDLRGGMPRKMSDPSRLDTAKEQIAVLENALKELDANFKTWREQEAERREEENDRIGGMNERLEEVEAIRIEQERINDTIIELTKGENSPFAKLPELQKTLDNLQGKSVEITELHKQIAALQEQVTTNLKTTEGLKVDVVKVKNYADEIKAIQNMIEALKGSDGDIFADAIKKLEAELAELEEKNNTFSDQFARFTDTVGKHNDRLKNAELRISEVGTKVDETAADVKEAKTTLSANEKDIKAFNDWKKQAATKDDVKKAQQDALQAERDRLEQELAKVRAEQEAAIDAAAREEAEARQDALKAERDKLELELAKLRAERDAAIRAEAEAREEALKAVADAEAKERQKAIGNLSNLYAPIGVERTLNNLITVELPKYATQSALTLVSDKVNSVERGLSTANSTLLQLGTDLENTKSTVSGLSVSTSGGTVKPTTTGTTSSTSRKVSGY